jgi:hypothetical protein
VPSVWSSPYNIWTNLGVVDVIELDDERRKRGRIAGVL